MKKKHDAAKVINELEGSAFFKKPEGAKHDTPIDTHDDTHIDTLNDTPDDTAHDGHPHVSVETHASAHQLPTRDAVDEMLFRYRKLSKVRANADMPEEWKDELDEYAHQHKLGKYHLVMYAVAKMLGKI